METDRSSVMRLAEEDRDYLVMMYVEHAEHARQHETLRAAVTGLMVALIAGLLAFAVEAPNETTGKQWVAGVLVGAVSILGVILNHKHYERYELHLTVLRGYRSALERGVSPELAEINDLFRKKHEAKYWFTHHWVRLRVLWSVIYAATFLIGAILVVRGTPPSFHHEASVSRQT